MTLRDGLQRVFEGGFARSYYSVFLRASGIIQQERYPLTSQTENSYSVTGTSHGAPATPDLRHHPQRQYKAKTQYQLVYAQVGYTLHDALSIDKAFKAINDVLTGDQISSLVEYCVR